MRCVNCGVATQRLRRHITSSLSRLLLTILAGWLTTEVSMDANICHSCFELLGSENAGDMRLFGHTMVCAICGRSVRNKQHHAIDKNYLMLHNLPRSHPAFHQVMNYVCHSCWMRHQRRLNKEQNRLNLPRPEPRPGPKPAPRPVSETEINLPTYEQTANTSTHCVFNGCVVGQQLHVEVQTVKKEVTEAVAPILEHFIELLPKPENASTSPVHTEVVIKKEELDIEENDPLQQLEMRRTDAAPAAGTSTLHVWPIDTKVAEAYIKKEIGPDDGDYQPSLSTTATVKSEPEENEVNIQEKAIAPRKRKRKSKERYLDD